MKNFFEQYGGVALGILALLVLVAMITPVGNITKTSLQGVVTKFSSSMNGQLDSAMNATSEAQKNALNVISGNEEDPVAPSIDLSNINKSGVVGDFSTKGNLVTINGNTFRVLKVEGTQVKVMMMDCYVKTKFNTTNIMATFTLTDGSTKTSLKYSGSILDKEMTNYYNSLPESIQNSIITQNIKQSLYKNSKPIKYSDKISEIEIGDRRVFAIDVDDVIEYLGENYSENELMMMFFNFDASSARSRYAWLRSASATGYETMGINAYYHYVTYYRWNNTMGIEARPAFVIDLSLL